MAYPGTADAARVLQLAEDNQRLRARVADLEAQVRELATELRGLASAAYRSGR